tara:strand:+ start:90 stop:1649 length:1560 start_codon:yes stop_codon:yes gene_type:complete
MNQLVKELIKELSPDQSTSRPKNVGVYAGSFKPPTNGHYKVVAQALADNPELDELRILIGTGKRDGIDQSQALLIWDIYKRYLPFKVVLVPVSEAPIKAVYDYAKENPEIKVDWILGAREGNEEDFTDIAKRTKAADNYPNITLRPTITDSGASGTAARNAYKVSQDKLEKLLPKKLSQEEKDKVYNILNRTIDESKLLKEVLDPKNFNFKPLIKSLTNSMEDDGLILKPYPKVQFIHNAKANSENFFGKTAYYDPDNNIIVLYTLGRHPKDILRSYAHELVHVHQNHEDRLENITTDNVNEDDYLEKIEREAYEEGNIAFRSWTNKMTEKKTKDPFGLNAFAYELARLNEDEENNWYVYVDMDGVIADFDKRFEDLSGLLPQDYVDKHGLDKFWDLIDEKHKVAFWRGIEIMPGAEKLLNYVSNYPYEILTAPSIKKQSIIGKGLWIKDKIGTLYSSKPKVTYRPAKLKHTVKPNLTKYDILIDDKKSTIERWNNAGGTAIYYVNADQVINDLKNLGL